MSFKFIAVDEVGLLERPVVLTSGKREKKKVERLSMSINMPSSEKKKVEIQEGAGTKLGDCPRSKFAPRNLFTSSDLPLLQC